MYLLLTCSYISWSTDSPRSEYMLPCFSINSYASSAVLITSSGLRRILNAIIYPAKNSLINYQDQFTKWPGKNTVLLAPFCELYPGIFSRENTEMTQQRIGWRPRKRFVNTGTPPEHHPSAECYENKARHADRSCIQQHIWNFWQLTRSRTMYARLQQWRHLDTRMLELRKRGTIRPPQ